MLAPRSLKREMGEVVPLDLLSVAFDPVLSLKDRHNSSDRESWVYQPRVYRSLEVFVADRLGDRGPCTSEPKLPGDPYRFHFSDGFCVSLRINCPEPSDPDVIKVEKITRVVEWMKYFSANTSIPMPHILSFSRDVSDVLPILGVPFYLVETVKRGKSLRRYLTALRESETVSASRTNEVRSNIYEQISQYYLESRRLTMDRIGSMSADSSGKWEVTKRPFTGTMEYLLSDIPDCPMHEWPEEPFSTAEDYFWFMCEQNMTALWGLRSLGVPRRLDPVADDVSPHWEDDEFNFDPEKVAKCARLRFRARHGFLQLIKELATEEGYSNGPFVPAMPHLDWELFRVIYDQRTKKINYLFEPRTINFMPLPFLCIPPPGLLSSR
uniref:Aminoglycoside phosphotransferase domain-containing protein n=1 Tax=Bionectria ochroleuca TaxID=29856 RepID=A0A8H7TTT4_BIOOC